MSSSWATAEDMERWAPIVFEDRFVNKGCGGKCYCFPSVFCIPIPGGCCLSVRHHICLLSSS